MQAYPATTREHYLDLRDQINPTTGEPYSGRESARLTNIHHETGRNWERDKREFGRVCSAREAGELPTKLEPLQQEIEAYVDEKPTRSLNQITSYVESLGVECHKTTCRDQLRKWGYRYQQGCWVKVAADTPVPSTAPAPATDQLSTSSNPCPPVSPAERENEAVASKPGRSLTRSQQPVNPPQEGTDTKNQGGRPLISLTAQQTDIIERLQSNPQESKQTLTSFVNTELAVPVSADCLDKFLVKIGEQALATKTHIALPLDRFQSKIQQWINNQPGIPYQTLLARLRNHEQFHCGFLMLRLYLQQRGLFQMVSFNRVKDQFQRPNHQQVACIRDKMVRASTTFCNLINQCDHRRSNAKKFGLGQLFQFLYIATMAKHYTIAAAADYTYYHYDTLVPSHSETTA